MKPLSGVTVIDLGGIGPGPFASMLLADMGADVIRIERVGHAAPANPVLDRGKRTVCLDLKSPAGREAALRLLGSADVALEGFRPGVAERLGVGPVDAWNRNPALVYGRVTGWGRSGKLAERAGHDLNYIATSGVLHSIGRADGPPQFPANLIGDYGGGGMLLVAGVLAALVHADRTGAGQIVDAAMIDGASLMWAALHGFEGMGQWSGGRGENELDSGAPYYDVYKLGDDRYVAVAALEDQFFAELVRRLGISLPIDATDGGHTDRRNWEVIRVALRDAFSGMDSADVMTRFDGSDACVALVLSRDAAEQSLATLGRPVFYRDRSGVRHPLPAPRFFDEPVDTDTWGRDLSLPTEATAPGTHTIEVLTDVGFEAHEIAKMIDRGSAGTPSELTSTTDAPAEDDSALAPLS